MKTQSNKQRAVEKRPRCGGPQRGLWGDGVPVGADIVTVDQSGLCARFFFVPPPSGRDSDWGVEPCVSQ